MDLNYMWRPRHLIQIKAKHSSLICTTLIFIFASEFEFIDIGINLDFDLGKLVAKLGEEES